MNNYKVFFTNSFFCILLIISYFFSQQTFFQILGIASLFALSGSITNWLAVYMLFEKIPFVIGSGVIPNHFDGFKKSIRKIILENFFKEENFQTIQTEVLQSDWKNKILTKINIAELFNSIIKDFVNSSNAGIFNMFGGKALLENFRKPFEISVKKKIDKILQDINFKEIFFHKDDYQNFLQKIIKMLDQELDKLTPQKVKQIIARIIKEHLSWLVVWGGVFGFVLGLIGSLFYSF